MRIGIDIDGVLTNIEQFILDYGSKFCAENNLPLNIKESDYNEKITFNWTEKQAIKFWNEYIMYYFTEYPARDFAPQIIKKLKDEGNEIYLITARCDYGVPKEYTGKVEEITRQWLKENDIKYDKIIFTEGNKLPYCVGNYIEVLIEDSPINIEEVAIQIPVICYNNQYNQNEKGKKVTRAYSWYDVYEKIKAMK